MRVPRVRLLLSTVVAVCAASSAAGQTAPPAPAAAHADSVYQAGNFAAAATAYESLARSAPASVVFWARWGISLQQTGKLEAALDAYAHVLTLQRPPVILYNMAAAHAKLGHADVAFAYLDSTVARGFATVSALDKDPDFDAVRSDPRYAKVKAAMLAAREPCVSQPESHQFDFWVGEWSVTNVAGQTAGHSVVQKILGQCVVFENWTDGQGGEGKSLNAYNPGLKQWQQFWTDQYGHVTEYRQSSWVNGSLQYIAHVPDMDSPNLQRMTFTPMDANTVRQFGETSSDGGQTWKTGYDLYYHRVK